MQLRVQGPSGMNDVDCPAGATFQDLKASVAAVTGIPPAAQELRSGFPPQLIEAADADLVSFVLEGGTRLIVKSTQAAAAPSPSGGGRKKPTAVRRITDGVNPRDAAAAAAAAPSACAAGAGPSSAAGDEPSSSAGAVPASGAAKRKRAAPSASAEAADDDADDGDGGPQADPLARTLQARGSGGGGGGGGKVAAPRAPKAKPIDKLASEYFNGSGSAVDAARGGKTTDFLSEHGMIEHRVSALSSRKYQLTLLPAKGKGSAQLCAEFKAVKKQVSETVQMLSRDELTQLLRALNSRGSSRRGGSFSHLLVPREMAARSAAVFWSFAHEFGGDVEGGAAQLLSEL